MTGSQQVVFEREISGGARRRHEVEAAIREACQEIVEGFWQAQVLPSRYSSWWVIRIEAGPRGAHFVLANKHQQHPDALRQRVGACLRRDPQLPVRRAAAA